MKTTSNAQKAMGIHVGSTTLVMIFAVICLTIFGVLSVITANNAWKLAEKTADGVTDYYTADAKAKMVFDDLTANYDGELSLPPDCLAQLELVEGQTYLNYWIPIDDNQSLWVQVSSRDGTLNVERWQVEMVGTWQADQTLTVWGG